MLRDSSLDSFHTQTLAPLPPTSNTTALTKQKVPHQKSKLGLKQLLQGQHQQSIFSPAKPSQQESRKLQRWKNNEKLFTTLQDTLATRKITFAKFAFKPTEYDEDRYLKPIIKGLFDKEKRGSMLVSELWTKDAQRQYLKCSQLQQPKRVLKRFAHWDWDQEFKNGVLKDASKSLHVNIFQNVPKKQNSVHRSSHMSRHEAEDDVSFYPGSSHYIKGIPESQTNIKLFRSSVDLNPSQMNSKRLSMPSLRDIYKVTPDNMRQMKYIIKELNELKHDCTKDISELKGIQTKIKTQIKRTDMRATMIGQNPFKNADFK